MISRTCEIARYTLSPDKDFKTRSSGSPLAKVGTSYEQETDQLQPRLSTYLLRACTVRTYVEHAPAGPQILTLTRLPTPVPHRPLELLLFRAPVWRKLSTMILNGTRTENFLVLVQLAVAFLVVLYLRSIARWRARTCGRPLPPGPKPLPIVGNMFDMPRSRQWVGYRDLSRELGKWDRASIRTSALIGLVEGDIMYFQVLGQSIMVIGSPEAMFEYLDKRSANTSDRVQTPMIEL